MAIFQMIQDQGDLIWLVVPETIVLLVMPLSNLLRIYLIM